MAEFELDCQYKILGTMEYTSLFRAYDIEKGMNVSPLTGDIFHDTAMGDHNRWIAPGTI